MKRIQLIDALRGLAIVLMVAFHFGVNLVEWGLAPRGLINNTLLNILQPFFAGVFILLSGMSSRFSRSNLRRGVIVLAFAYIVSVVTILMNMPIYFGILHFLGVSMVLYGLVGAKIVCPQIKTPIIYAVLFIAAFILFPRQIELDTNIFMPFGLYSDTRGTDYFPLFPWLFLFLFGTWLGGLAPENKFPKWFYEFKMPILPAIGRYGLLIYLAHQPILYGIFWLVGG